MRKILTILIAIIVCVVVAVGAYFLVIKKNGFSVPQTSSPNILYLTNPVLSFSGKIESIKGNTITVSRDMVLNQAPSLQVNPNQTSKVQTKKITYQILINDKTLISQAPETLPYLFKQISQPATPATSSANINKLTIKDLKTGQYITANSTTDLRTINGNQFEATFINLSPNILSVYGRIKNINNNEIIVSGIANMTSILPIINQQSNQEKEYIFTIDQNTEISKNVASNSPTIPSKAEKYSLSDLKKDLQVIIYAEGDVDSNQKMKALIVNPLFSVNIPLTQPSQPSTPAQSTKSGTQKPK